MKVKLSENLFLSVQELNRMKQALQDSGYKQLVRYLTKSIGIAQDANNTLFKVSPKMDSNTVVVINAGVAFDSNLDPIVMEENKEIEYTTWNSVDKHWLILKRAVHNNEVGTVSVSASGVLTGVDTKFTEVLRGGPDFATKIKFDSAANNGTYEVVEVTSDTSAIISGSFAAQSGMKYQVVGTFTPGFQPDENDAKIYEYDYYEIEDIISEEKPELGQDEFLLASIYWTAAGVIQVVDERTPYLFNFSGDTDVTINNITKDDVLSLTKSRLLANSKQLEIRFEAGLTVKQYKMVTTSTNNIFTIQAFQCNFINEEDIPNNIFKNWLLVNRANMQSAVIDSNDGGALTISRYNSSLMVDADSGIDNDFVVIPNFKEVEVEVGTIGDNYEADEPKFYHKYSLVNPTNRFVIPIEYGYNRIDLKYRLVSENETTPFQPFNTAQFVNTINEKETLSDSYFEFTFNEPEVELENYS